MSSLSNNAAGANCDQAGKSCTDQHNRCKRVAASRGYDPAQNCTGLAECLHTGSYPYRDKGQVRSEDGLEKR